MTTAAYLVIHNWRKFTEIRDRKFRFFLLIFETKTLTMVQNYDFNIDFFVKGLLEQKPIFVHISKCGNLFAIFTNSISICSNNFPSGPKILKFNTNISFIQNFAISLVAISLIKTQILVRLHSLGLARFRVFVPKLYYYIIIL